MNRGCRLKQECREGGFASAPLFRSLVLAGRFLAGFCLLSSLCACGSGGGGEASQSPSSDLTPPELIMTSPADGDNDAALQRTLVAAFSEALDPATLGPASFYVTDAQGGLVPGRVAWDEQARLALFTPDEPFSPASSYTAQLTAAITDPAGNPLTPAAWSFNSVAPVSAFDEGHPFWLDEGGNPAAVVTDHFRTGNGAILLDTGSAALAREVTSPPLYDFTLGTDQSLKLWLYLPQVAEDHLLFLEFRQNGAGNYAWTALTALSVDGWYCLTRTRADFLSGGGFDWNQPIDTINLWLTAASPRADIRVYVDSLWIGGRDFQNAVITFDDGYKSDYTEVFPAMSAHGMTATSFINSGDIGYFYALEQPDMNKMYAEGWEFGNHTAYHYGLTEISPTDWLADLTAADQWLQEEGYLSARQLLSFPYGEFATVDHQTIDDEISAAGIDAARTVFSYPLETGSGRINSLRYPATVELGPATSLADAKTAIDDAIRYGHSVMIYGHEIVDGPPGPYKWNRDDFTALVAYLAQQRDAHLLRVPSFGQLHAWLAPAP
jgi:peptidoglycan/xylan/chitin deacetylase (PgdA/CDA1 family)